MPHLLRLSFLLAVLAVAPVAADARALRIDRAVARDCLAGPFGGDRPGALRIDHTPARDGLLTLRLRGRGGDWDLAVFDGTTGDRRGGAAGLGPRETVTLPVRGERPLAIQVCRRRGRAPRARLGMGLVPLPKPAGDREPVQLLRVNLLGDEDYERLVATGVDVTHAHAGRHVEVVSYSEADRAALVRAGLTWSVRIADLGAVTRRALRPGSARAAQAAGTLPSARTSYREYADYQADLKALAEGYPSTVRLLSLGKSLEGRDIQAVEIARDVAREDDGRPTLVVLGLQHAREWPSGEMPMELAFDLARFHAGDPRIRSLLDRVRVVVVPVVNPDGFAVSRSSAGMQALEAGAYKRKNCRPRDAQSAQLPCALRLHQGVDLTRNHGAYWGGPGSGSDPLAADHRGPAPYSEPEAQAVRKLLSGRAVVTLVSHHTYTAGGTWLRQPGFCRVKPQGRCSEAADVVPDEPALGPLGGSLAQATGWTSQLGWKIGEVTGAAEDWSYFATGAYAHTPEQRGADFHPPYADAVVREYTGVGAPGASGGMREALLRAAEQAADRRWHAHLTGSAPAGATLRLRKAFATPTAHAGLTVPDSLELTLTVPDSGTFSWDVNPSTRPLAAEPELYELTCEEGGVVRQTLSVLAERGETQELDLLCGRPAQERKPGDDAPRDPGPAPAPAPAPAEAPPRPAPAGASPAPAALRPPPVVRLTRPPFRARAFNRTGRIGVAVRLDGGPLRNVRLGLWDRRGRKRYAVARLTLLPRDGRLVLVRIPRHRLRPGTYKVTFRGTDQLGRRVATRAFVRVSA